MDRKEAIAFLRHIADGFEACGTMPRSAAALKIAIESMEKLEEVEVWLKAQEAGLFAATTKKEQE